MVLTRFPSPLDKRPFMNNCREAHSDALRNLFYDSTSGNVVIERVKGVVRNDHASHKFTVSVRRSVM